MRGMEKIIMSNFPARSTQIQHKSDFVQFAIYKKKPRNHYGFKVFLMKSSDIMRLEAISPTMNVRWIMPCNGTQNMVFIS